MEWMGSVWSWISGKIRTCSDTKYDVPTQGMEDTIKNNQETKGEFGQKVAHGLATGTHGRAREAEPWREEGKWGKKGRERGKERKGKGKCVWIG